MWNQTFHNLGNQTHTETCHNPQINNLLHVTVQRIQREAVSLEKNRSKWFGKQNNTDCSIIKKEIKKAYLDV